MWLKELEMNNYDCTNIYCFGHCDWKEMLGFLKIIVCNDFIGYCQVLASLWTSSSKEFRDIPISLVLLNWNLEGCNIVTKKKKKKRLY